MIKRLSALVLLTMVSVTLTNEDPPQIPFKVVDVGGNVTLHCPVSNTGGKFFHWYKQPLGHMMQTVASASIAGLKLTEQFKNNRFNLAEGASQYSLTIKNISKDDEAAYLCQNGTAYFQSFAAGVYLAVNDCNRETVTRVRQTPETASVQEGDMVTLHCSLLSKTPVVSSQCSAKYDVHWFRVGSGESHLSFIYTHKNSSDAHNSSCVHRLSKTIRNSSDTGIYYCAVVTCGEILFGEGTKVETNSKLSPVIIVLGVLLACCVTVIVALIIYIYKAVFENLKVENNGPARQLKSSGSQPSDKDAGADEANYVALNFSTRKTKGMKRRTESPPECVYSAVRAGHPTQN
ncbi:uncharacterized protein LOC110369460 [Fundulus heteroclitus]|uniref:uncharacterized protein LOC110369460 n=1 Tax=Fundulus heteroclitus TaxID=8078 RepID=UPI00165CA609|nr:uncharacterized protein LOC110369460 [Fundulus heteroclitus]